MSSPSNFPLFMANISEFNYETLDSPFDSLMEREGGLFGEPGLVDLGSVGEGNVKKIVEKTVEEKINEEQPVIDGKNLENIWIDKWIKSRSYLPGKRGFLIDGQKGFIECANLKVRGSGEIGGWNIDATRIYSDDDDVVLDSANKRIVVGTANKIFIDGANKRIQSDNYVSGYAGTGFHLSDNLLEVGNIACRGLIRTSVFQKDVISAMGGNFMVLDADVLDADMTADDTETLTTKGTTTFSTGDILRIKDGTDDEWLEVTVVNGNTYTVTRDKAGAYGADANPAWKRGATVVNYGQSGDGGVYMTASESNAPYLSVFTTAGSPWTDLSTRLRIGKLDGYLDYPADGDKYGIGIGSSAGTDANLVFDPTNGIRLRCGTTDKITLDNAGNVTATGTINATSGKFGTATNYWDITATGIVATTADTDIYIAGGAGLDYANWTADGGFILGKDYSDGDKAKFFVGDHANNKYFKFDGANTDATGFRYIEVFTAGEDITAGNVICFQNAYTDFETTHDAMVDNNNPTVNYGSLLYMNVDGHRRGLLLFAPTGITSRQVLRAELRMYVRSKTGTPTMTIYRNGTSFDESTVTWNTKPVTVSTIYGVDTTQQVLGTGWQTFDVTNLVKLWLGGDYGNTGIQIEADSVFQADTKEGTYAPTLRIYKINSYETSGGECTAWKADNTVIENCMKVIGIATETKTAGNAVKVQVMGINGDATAAFPGQDIYLGTSGAVVGDIGSVSGKRIIKVGRGTKDNNVMIDIDDNNSLIDFVNGLGLAEYLKTYCPDNTKKVIVRIDSREGEFVLKRGETTKYFPYSLTAEALITVTSANKVTTDKNLATKAYFYR